MSNNDKYLTNLKNKSIIITGGASGIGLATAQAFAAAGGYVTIADLASSRGGEIAQELTVQGHHVQFAECDTTVWTSLVAAFKKAVQFSPDKTLDVAVLAAGIAREAGTTMVQNAMATELSLDVDPAEPGKRTIDVNLVGVYWSSWLALYYFRLPSASAPPGPASTSTSSTASTDTGSLQKSLVLIASTAGYSEFSGASSTYWASKWGVRGLWQSIKHDTKLVGARCNLIAPSFVRTPMTAYLEGIVGTWVVMEDVVEAIGRCAGEVGTDGMLQLSGLQSMSLCRLIFS
jgi:5'-hydroxyaverantin dehydrogenase